jgi:hypothetical protein
MEEEEIFSGLGAGTIIVGLPPITQPVFTGGKGWSIQDTLEDVIGKPYSRFHFSNVGTEGSYKFYICNSSGDKNIFSLPNVGYKIELRLCFRNYPINNVDQNRTGFITLEIGCGNLNVITKSYKISDYDEIVTENFFYQVTDFGRQRPNGQNFWIRKVGIGTVKVIGSIVTYGSYSYDNEYNNKIHDFFSTQTIPSVNLDSKKIQTLCGQKTRFQFGNGKFKQGIWKSGVWNNGYRSLWPGEIDDLMYFESVNLNTFQVNPNRWFLKIESNTNTDNVINILQNLFINDFVTIGNVVGIDINEERYLLKDYYRVSEIIYENDVVTITLDIPVAKFPLRRFEIDSDIHLIYVTKNIWSGGTFLNGLFRGVWSYGLFKGYPFTTIMDQSHFVDGKFDGGRFISRVSGITGIGGVSREYHTGLVQFMEFYDNNISEKESTGNQIDNTYQSWMDLNYYTQSFVNLNSLTSIFDQNFGKLVPLPNLYGYPTKDVISSRSKFKNTTDDGVDFYNLGTKYKIFTDHLGQSGFFTKAFNSEGRPGIDGFVGQGWTANQSNFYGTPTVSFAYSSNITRRNFNRFTVVMATFGYNVLNNDNIQVDEKRYVVVEYDLEYFTRGYDKLSGQFTNSFQRPLSLLGSNYNSLNNVFRSGIVKTEYFYNKNALDLILRYNSTLQLPTQGLGIYGYNVTHSLPPVGESNPSFSTTWSMIAPATDSLYRGDPNVVDPITGLTPSPLIPLEWSSATTYNKGSIARNTEPGSDALGYFYMSLTDSNTGNFPGLNPTYWERLFVAFNDLAFENTTLAFSDIFSFFTSFRSSYFKFLEIDALPFFKYYDFESNFVDTYKEQRFVSLEFTKPHGYKTGDEIKIKLDETAFNPQYDTITASVLAFVDGKEKNDDAVYTIKTSIPWGVTPSFIAESGTIFRTDGADRIDKRIQQNYSATSPKVTGLNEDFTYLGNNQIFVDRSDF